MAGPTFTYATNGDPSTAAEVEGIKHALHALLTVATDRQLIRRHKPPQKDEGPKPVSFDVMKLFEQTSAERTAATLILDPIGESVRNSVVVLGERLHELGGSKLMIDVLDDVAERDPANHARRVSIMDHRWSGIGSWVA